MANNRLYIADPNTRKAAMIAKSFGTGWKSWHANYPGETAVKLDAIFSFSDELGSLGDGTELKLITEYDKSFGEYEIIEIPET